MSGYAPHSLSRWKCKSNTCNLLNSLPCTLLSVLRRTTPKTETVSVGQEQSVWLTVNVRQTRTYLQRAPIRQSPSSFYRNYIHFEQSHGWWYMYQHTNFILLIELALVIGIFYTHERVYIINNYRHWSILNISILIPYVLYLRWYGMY